MHKNVRLVNKVDIASHVMAIVTPVVVMGGMYYLNPTTSRLSLLLHKSEAKPRMGVNKSDNLWV